jgi:hypothetical protein
MLFQPFEEFSVEYLFHHAVQQMRERNPEKGISLAAAAAALINHGQPAEAVWPYHNILPADLSHWKPPSGCKVFKRQLPTDKKSFPQICQLLDAGRPTVLILKISEGFYMPDANGMIEEQHSDPEVGTHAVVAVGYGNVEACDCIFIRNSWGTTWGLNGHALLTRQYLENRLISTVTLL